MGKAETKDSGPSWLSSYQYTTSADMTSAADLTPAPPSGQKLVITDIILSADTAMLFELKEETSGTVIGVLILGVITSGFTMLRIDSDYQSVVKGLIILAAVYIDQRRNASKSAMAA